jgi:hypothetical protein
MLFLHGNRDYLASSALLGLCLLVFVGCGKSQSGIALSGGVMFDGKPVEVGQIVFEPQSGGKMTLTQITNGIYQLPSERPAQPGKYLVRITADRPTGRTIAADPRSQEDQATEELEQYIPAKYNTRSELYLELTDQSPDKHDFALTTN